MKDHKEKVVIVGASTESNRLTLPPETRTMVITSRGYEKTARIVASSLDTISDAARTATSAFSTMKASLEPWLSDVKISKHNKAAALRFKARHKK